MKYLLAPGVTIWVVDTRDWYAAGMEILYTALRQKDTIIAVNGLIPTLRFASYVKKMTWKPSSNVRDTLYWVSFPYYFAFHVNFSVLSFLHRSKTSPDQNSDRNIKWYKFWKPYLINIGWDMNQCRMYSHLFQILINRIQSILHQHYMELNK